jgi:hypothetical protein
MTKGYTSGYIFRQHIEILYSEDTWKLHQVLSPTGQTSMPQNVAHFDDERWVDFVRHVGSREETARMKNHLDSGCETCQLAFKLWCFVLEAAKCERLYEPPDLTVRLVKAAFAFRRKLRGIEPVAQVASLESDPTSEQFKVEVRTTPFHGRFSVENGSRFAMDLRVEAENGSKACLSGRVLPLSGSRQKTIGAGILLMDKDQNIIAQAITNSLGKFQLHSEARERLTLYVELAGERPIAVSIPQWAFNPLGECETYLDP